MIAVEEGGGEKRGYRRLVLGRSSILWAWGGEGKKKPPKKHSCSFDDSALLDVALKKKRHPSGRIAGTRAEIWSQKTQSGISGRGRTQVPNMGITFGAE